MIQTAQTITRTPQQVVEYLDRVVRAQDDAQCTGFPCPAIKLAAACIADYERALAQYREADRVRAEFNEQSG